MINEQVFWPNGYYELPTSPDGGCIRSGDSADCSDLCVVVARRCYPIVQRKLPPMHRRLSRPSCDAVRRFADLDFASNSFFSISVLALSSIFLRNSRCASRLMYGRSSTCDVAHAISGIYSQLAPHHDKIGLTCAHLWPSPAGLHQFSVEAQHLQAQLGRPDTHFSIDLKPSGQL
jgi:hypothetical protein